MEESVTVAKGVAICSCGDGRARCRFAVQPSFGASSRGFHEFPTTVRVFLSRVVATRTIGALPLRCRHLNLRRAVSDSSHQRQHSQGDAYPPGVVGPKDHQTGGRGSYWMARLTAVARSVEWSRTTKCRAISMPAETPAETPVN